MAREARVAGRSGTFLDVGRGTPASSCGCLSGEDLSPEGAALFEELDWIFREFRVLPLEGDHL